MACVCERERETEIVCVSACVCHTKAHNAECHYAECCMIECRYAECRHIKRPGTIILRLHNGYFVPGVSMECHIQ